MAWKKYLKLGLALTEAVAPGGGIPRQILKTAHAALGEKESRNPERGADFAAASLREVLQASFPNKTMERIDHIAIRFAETALKQRLSGEVEELKPKPKRKSKRKSKPKRKSRRGRGRYRR